MKPITLEEFDQWSRLPHAVVRRNFWWAYRSKRNQSGDRPFRCALDYDDLISEGNLALIDAWSLYDEERKTGGRHATFKTYAYRSIFNRISRFVDANISQMTTKDWKNARGDEDRKQLKAACGCMLFSDLVNNGLSEWQGLTDKMAGPAEEAIEKAEWIETCMNELRTKLGRRKTRVLLRWVSGATLVQLGRTLGVTREWARILINEWMVQASAILAGREEDYLEK